MKKEIKVFEKQKAKDLKKAIKDYVNTSIRYEKLNLQNLEKTLQDMKQPVIRTNPFMYQQHYQQQLQQQQQQQNISPSASFTTTSHVFDDDSSATSSNYPESRQKKRRQKQHLHQNYKELQKPLQSSASLPTRNRKNNENQNDSDSSESGTTHNRTIIPRDDTTTATNRISMSASYDDRLSSTNWLSEAAGNNHRK